MFPVPERIFCFAQKEKSVNVTKRQDRLKQSSRAGENAQEPTNLSRHLISNGRLKLSFTFKYLFLKMAPDSVKEIKHHKRESEREGGEQCRVCVS